jgi:hypothetical protein
VPVKFAIGDRVREPGSTAEGTVCGVPFDVADTSWANAPEVVWIVWDATPKEEFWQFDEELERVS